MKWLTRWLSKSSPAKWVSPAVAVTAKIPSLMVKRDIEGSSTEIGNEHVALADHLLVETVRDSSSRGVVDNTKDVHVKGVRDGAREVRDGAIDGMRDSAREVRDGVRDGARQVR